MNNQNAIRRRLATVEKQLEKLRGREYLERPGTARRAKLSRKVDYLAIERTALRTALEPEA